MQKKSSKLNAETERVVTTYVWLPKEIVVKEAESLVVRVVRRRWELIVVFNVTSIKYLQACQARASPLSAG